MHMATLSYVYARRSNRSWKRAAWYQDHLSIISGNLINNARNVRFTRSPCYEKQTRLRARASSRRTSSSARFSSPAYVFRVHENACTGFISVITRITPPRSRFYNTRRQWAIVIEIPFPVWHCELEPRWIPICVRIKSNNDRPAHLFFCSLRKEKKWIFFFADPSVYTKARVQSYARDAETPPARMTASSIYIPG